MPAKYPEAGNWKSFQFQRFAWDHRYGSDVIPDPKNWTVIYTNHRDATLIEQSNAAMIDKLLQPYISRGSVVPETHAHWAMGYVSGYAIRVRTRHGRITSAYKAYCRIQDRLENYPLLDEEEYSNRKHEATVENLKFHLEFGEIRHRSDVGTWPVILPEEVYHWLSENNDYALENVDDEGGCTDEDDILAAVKALHPELLPEETDRAEGQEV